MAAPEFIKYLNPKELYLLAPQFMDWILLTWLLSLIFMRAFAGIKGKNLLGELAGGLLGKKAKEHIGGEGPSKTDRAISFVLALIISTNAVAFTKFSFKGLMTSSWFPFFIGFIIFFPAYAFLSAKLGKDRKFLAFAIALFIAVATFGALVNENMSQYLGAFVTLAIFLALVGSFSKSKPAERETAESAKSDASRSARDIDNLAEQLLRARQGATDVKRTDSQVEQQLTSMRQAAERANQRALKAGQFMRLLQSAFAAALLLFAQNKTNAQIRNELNRDYPQAVVSAVMRQLPSRPSTPATPEEAKEAEVEKKEGKEKPAEKPEDVKLPAAENKALVEELKNLLAQLNAGQATLDKSIEANKKMASGLQDALNQAKLISSSNAKLKSDVDALKQIIDEFRQRMEKQGNSKLAQQAMEMAHRAEKLAGEAAVKTSQFASSTEQTLPVLDADFQVIQKTSTELEWKKLAIKQIIDNAQPVVAQIESGATNSDISATAELLSKLESELQSASTFVETHKDVPDMIGAIVPSVQDAARSQKQFVDSLSEELEVLLAQLDAAQRQEKQAEKVSASVQKAEGLAADDLLKAKSQVQALISLFETIRDNDFSKFKGNDLKTWFSNSWGPFYTQLSSSINQLIRTNDDLNSWLTEYGNSMSEQERRQVQDAIGVVKTILSKETGLKSVCDSVERLRAEGQSEDQKQVQRFMVRLQDVSTDDLRALLSKLDVEVQQLATDVAKRAAA